MGWRPEDWKNPKTIELTFDVYEAGADAIEKIIKDELQGILDDNDSDQDKLNKISCFVDKLTGGN